MQLDLLSYQPTPEEMAIPAPQPQPVNRHALAWQEAKADFYLRLMNRFMRGSLPQQIKRHEIERLHQLRQQALAEMEEGR